MDQFGSTSFSFCLLFFDQNITPAIPRRGTPCVGSSLRGAVAAPKASTLHLAVGQAAARGAQWGQSVDEERNDGFHGKSKGRCLQAAFAWIVIGAMTHSQQLQHRSKT